MANNPVLQPKDGFDSVSPQLREAVARLQRILDAQGYDVDVDGLFGSGTEDAVKHFQRTHGLLADGVVGPQTWGVLERIEKAASDPVPTAPQNLDSPLAGFHGDASWVHAQEGHAGKAYWPGGASGVTLDPGVDLGHARPELIEKAYRPLLRDDEYAAVKAVLGLRGLAAKQALAGNPVLKGIRISRDQADAIFHYAAIPYWEAIVRRFPVLGETGTPGQVQTALLSISYNRGAGNRSLEILETPLKNRNWWMVADIIGRMQQDHQLGGIRKRRRMEADLIRKAL